MFRLKVAVIIGGIFMLVYGFQEYRVSSGTTGEPNQVDLAQIESGQIPENNHLAIGRHSAIYPAVVYAYRQSKYDSSEPTGSTSVDYCYYPIISDSHPFVLGLADLQKKYGNLQAVPDSEFPEVGGFGVLVKTKRFKTIGAIPDDWKDESGVTGLVINRISSLDGDEEKLLLENFPNMDLDKVLILQEGRKPSSILAALGLVLGGLVVSGAGGAWMFVGRKG